MRETSCSLPLKVDPVLESLGLKVRSCRIFKLTFFPLKLDPSKTIAVGTYVVSISSIAVEDSDLCLFHSSCSTASSASLYGMMTSLDLTTSLVRMIHTNLSAPFILLLIWPNNPAVNLTWTDSFVFSLFTISKSGNEEADNYFCLR